MKSKYKILVTDINRKKNLDSNIPLYVDELNSQYNCYATVKMSMNYYTLKEMELEKPQNTKLNVLHGLWDESGGTGKE